jgi:hypothetical protein
MGKPLLHCLCLRHENFKTGAIQPGIT